LPTIRSITPDGYPAPTIFSHVVVAEGTRLVFIAGQVAVNEKGEFVGEGDMRAQARQVFENLKRCLTAAGAGFENLVRLDTYAVDMSPEARAAIFETRREYLPADALPAGATIGVASLGSPRILLEIQGMAVL
jgi:enamine deaminase RidA (YjgF/YER057c/UK114 family)